MKKINTISKLIFPVPFAGSCNLFICILSFILLVTPFYKATAQTDNNDLATNTEVYDEIPVTVLIEGYGHISINAIYTEKNQLFINVEELFKYLKINCAVSVTSDSISGFIENEYKPYLIDYSLKKITTFNKMYNLKKGLMKEMGIIYLEASQFENIFGITITFNFRSLACILKANFELPVIKELRLEQMHNSLSKIKGEVKIDTIVKRNYHLFKFGMADWSFTTSQTSKQKSLNRFSIGLGAELLFGEADISYNYTNQVKYDGRQLNYLWQWVDNDKKIIRQAQLGKITPSLISFVNSPIVGGSIRNTPTTLRKATGYYTINEVTEPNWTVELYINNELVDYTKSDASGNYIFKVPIVYGFTTLKLKFYGPLGEERTEDRTFNTAFVLMPAKEFDYGVSAGILQDSLGSQMAKAELNYGVNPFFTLGGGFEYLSSIKDAPYIPFTKLTFQPFGKLVLNFAYAHGVKTSALVNYYIRNNSFLEINYAKFKEGQKATPFYASQELRAKFFMPLKYKMISINTTVDYSKLVYENYSLDKLSLNVAGYYKQFNLNSFTELNWAPLKTENTSFAKTTMALSYRLKSGLNMRASTMFSLYEKNILMYTAEIEKSIKKLFFSLSYQKNIFFNTYTVGLTLRYDLKFLRANLSTFINKNSVTTSQSAQGSFAFGGGNKFVYASQLTAISKGGIALYPFLDLNQNGIFDKNEHLIKLSSLKIMSSNVIFNDKDSIIRIPGLYAFTSYNLQFNDRDLDNISWQFKHHSYNVLIDPNQFKRIDIPVISMGEVNGMVFMNTNNKLKGIGRILVKIYNQNSKDSITQILSEQDGYIQYLGLKPGEYTASVDSLQLNKLGFSVTPSKINFTIKSSEQGDIAGPVNFVLKKEEEIKMPVN